MADNPISFNRAFSGGPVLLTGPIFADNRGTFYEGHRVNQIQDALGLTGPFVQSNVSISKKGVLRGMHYQLQNPQGKLMRCLWGRILDVAVDLRRSSSRYGAWRSMILHGGKNEAFYVPPGFAHGFLAIDDSVVSYECTTYYDQKSERALSWKEPFLRDAWLYSLVGGADNLIISDKDQAAPFLDFLEERGDIFK